jgi:cell wall-associated NlpC family hydrolase
VPPTGANNGRLAGATGTLAGTNPLQQSIDSLTRAVQTLTTSMSSSQQTPGGSGTSQQATARANNSFPSMMNPFQANARQGGIGGGGAGGAGNVSAPATFRSFGSMAGPMMLGSAVASFGQQQMNPLLTLNQYATSSMIGMNTNGMSRGQAMQAMYRQAGATPGSLNGLALSPTDAINSLQYLQQRAGSMMPVQTAIGRATLGAQASFGMMNPTLGASASAQLAAALYSPQFSLNMMTMGYRPILNQRPGGAPLNAGQAAQSILQWMGLGKMNSSQVFGNLSSGAGQANLSALFGPSGISNQTASQFLTGYSQLFSKGLNPSQATQLFQQASSGNLSQMKSAQQRLNQLGIATSANDIQAMKNSQAVLTGREGSYAGGFNQGLQDSTGLLQKFNTALNDLLKGPLGSLLGYGGGAGGILSGTSHAVGSLGTLGGLMTVGKLLGRGGGAAGAAGGAGLAGGLGAILSSAALPVGAGLAAWAGIQEGRTVLSSMGIHNFMGLGGSQIQMSLEMQSIAKSNLPASTKAHLLHLITLADQGQTLSSSQMNQIARGAGMGGGAAPVSGSSTTQSRTGGNNMSSISGSAKSAVSAAESQVGVPYEWGGEIPGVGFDCSGLVQWAYKQAGVNLPRTSQEQWLALAKRSIALNKVQEGDLVFTAGSDGTSNSPGHVGMMINSRQLIQAPHGGADVQVIGYDPNAWQHAARPSGSGSFMSGTSSGLGVASAVQGNRGLGMGSGGTYGSVNEADVIASMGVAGAGGARSVNGSSGGSNTITGGSGGSANVPSNARTVAAIARKLAQGYGWSSGMQWQDLVNVINAESGWRVTATNPQSGAYGIPQALPPDKMASAGPDWRTNPATQLKWMLGYIKQSYGTPAQAWQHEQSVHWYGEGGTTRPGWNIVGDKGPELRFESGGNQVFSNSQTMALINAIKGSAPAKSPWPDASPSSSSSAGCNINFAAGAIVFQGSGTTKTEASNAGREVARQIIKHINNEAVHTAIRSGDKF